MNTSKIRQETFIFVAKPTTNMPRFHEGTHPFPLKEGQNEGNRAYIRACLMQLPPGRVKEDVELKLGVVNWPFSSPRNLPLALKLEKAPKAGSHTHQAAILVRDEDQGHNRFWRIGRAQLKVSEGGVGVESIVHLKPLLVDEQDHEVVR